MCKYCEENGFNTIIESNYEQYAWNIFGNIHILDEPDINDNSVVIDIRCDTGYIRLGDRQEMGCLDHCDKIEINYCPMCGRKLGEQ